MASDMKTRHWEVESHDDAMGGWTWQCIRADGSTERASERIPSFGKAISDALKHGLDPRQEHWIIKSAGRLTHYRPRVPPASGKIAATLSRGLPPASENPEGTRSESKPRGRD